MPRVSLQAGVDPRGLSPRAIWVVVTSRWPTCSLTLMMPPCRGRFNDRQRALPATKSAAEHQSHKPRSNETHRLCRNGATVR